MRQKIEFQKSRALIQALMSQQGAQDEHIKKVFDELNEAFFPFDKNQKESELKRMREAMRKAVSAGPLAVFAQDDGKAARTVASRLKKGQRNLEERKAQEAIGLTRSIDPFETARRRPRNAL